ncbi:MAG: hypothetical protein WCJ58_07145 [bacterium]
MKNSHPLQIKKVIKQVKITEEKPPQVKHDEAQRIADLHEIIPLDSQFQLVDVNKHKPGWIAKAKKKIIPEKQIAEIPSYTKDFFSVGAFMSVLAFEGFFVYLLIQNYNHINKQFPLFFSQASQSWQMMDKEILPIYAVITLGLNLLILKFNHSTFSFDKRLCYMINVALILFNILGIIAFWEIFSLVLI